MAATSPTNAIPDSLTPLIAKFPNLALSPQLLQNLQTIDQLAQQILEGLKSHPKHWLEKLSSPLAEMAQFIQPCPQKMKLPYPPPEKLIASMYAIAAIMGAWQMAVQYDLPESYEEARYSTFDKIIELKYCCKLLVTPLLLEDKFTKLQKDLFWQSQKSLLDLARFFHTPPNPS